MGSYEDNLRAAIYASVMTRLPQMEKVGQHGSRPVNRQRFAELVADDVMEDMKREAAKDAQGEPETGDISDRQETQDIVNEVNASLTPEALGETTDDEDGTAPEDDDEDGK